MRPRRRPGPPGSTRPARTARAPRRTWRLVAGCDMDSSRVPGVERRRSVKNGVYRKTLPCERMICPRSRFRGAEKADAGVAGRYNREDRRARAFPLPFFRPTPKRDPSTPLTSHAGRGQSGRVHSLSSNRPAGIPTATSSPLVVLSSRGTTGGKPGTDRRLQPCQSCKRSPRSPCGRGWATVPTT